MRTESDRFRLTSREKAEAQEASGQNPFHQGHLQSLSIQNGANESQAPCSSVGSTLNRLTAVYFLTRADWSGPYGQLVASEALA